MRKAFFIILSLIAFSSCSLKITTKYLESYPVLDYKQEVVVIGLNGDVPDGSEVIGFVKISDTGFTSECTYDIVIDKAMLEARKIGGNAIKITVHSKPSVKSSCHQIEAKILFIEDLNNSCGN